MVGFQTIAQKLPDAQLYVPPGTASSISVAGEMDGAVAACDPAPLSWSTAVDAAPSGAGRAVIALRRACGEQTGQRAHENHTPLALVLTVLHDHPPCDC